MCREEAMVRIRHGTTDWFKVEKGVRQGCISSLCLFNIYAETIMLNSRLAESQARIKIVGRNISNLRYTGDCSHEIRRHLLLRIKAMTNLDSILQSRDIILLTKVHIVKTIVFPVVMYRCES